ncbi:AAA-like domain-containing protein [Anabaena sphaerica FACHB-251]|uniref:AAA-like domain-containing protein n=1 Tax=Anabaena sphaerica FACHB-251 TaxID=2692883 RepID=A0A926WKT2_9NOST|nr:AAA-like domain-containing protein [Anabaena sphaerica]MBD2296446.1 AAA-like domain-containing protein [Anabaena sphaerica FACHB-251]
MNYPYFRSVLRKSCKIDSAQAFKLRSLGLIEFQGNEVKCLCNLYRLYFQDRLS